MHFHTIDHFLFETTPAKELGLMAFSGFEDLFALCHTFLATTKKQESLQPSNFKEIRPVTDIEFDVLSVLFCVAIPSVQLGGLPFPCELPCPYPKRFRTCGLVMSLNSSPIPGIRRSR